MKELIDFWTTVQKNPITPFALCFSAGMFWLGVYSSVTSGQKTDWQKNWEKVFSQEFE